MKFDERTGQLKNMSNVIRCGGCASFNTHVKLPDGTKAGNGICNIYHGRQLHAPCRRCNGTTICQGCGGKGIVVI